MSELFDSYVSEFQSLKKSIQDSIDDIQAAGKADCESKISTTDSLFDQINEIHKQMGIEARSSPNRKQLNERVAEFKTQISDLRTEFERVKVTSQRSALIGDRSAAQQDQMLSNNEKLSRQNDAILNATRIANETIDVGTSIIDELAQNREKITGIQDKTRTLHGEIDAAGSKVKSMQAREDRCTIS